MIIEEYIKNFTPEELKLHELLKDQNESVLYEYVLKRTFYKDPTKEEIDKINDIYEEGVTYIDVTIRDKHHKLKLLSTEDKSIINKLMSEYEKSLTGNEESIKARIFDQKILTTIALSLKEIGGKPILNEADIQITALGDDTAGIIKFLSLLPYVMIKSLYDKYIEFESRIYDIFSYESIRKK